MRRNRRRTGLLAAIATVALAAVVVPTTAGAGSEHIVETLVNVPSQWEFDDPCTGIAVHGAGTESGVVHTVELGDRGHHVRGKLNGTVRLFNDSDNFVGTWTYELRFGDQFPPDAQGAAHFVAMGSLAYAGGSTATVHVHGQTVFEKGDTVKRGFFKAVCPRKK